MQENKRILIFDVNWLGDVLFSTAAIRNIRYSFPGSFIACVIPFSCFQVLEGNPYLDEIVFFDERKEERSLFSKIKFIRLLKKKKFDIVFLLHGSFTRALICKLAGIDQRIGYDIKKRGLTKKIAPPDKDKLHRIDYYLKIIEGAGFEIKDRHLDFFVASEDEDVVDKFLSENGVNKGDFLVGINSGGNWGQKRWPKEYWADLADRIINKYAAKIIISGGMKDKGLAEEIRSLMKNKPITAAGIFTLKQSGALFKKLDLFVSADTGPLHIASAVGTKRIIALFGPTSPKITGPYPLNNNILILQKKNDRCQVPCYVVDCKDNRCMKAITPGEILTWI